MILGNHRGTLECDDLRKNHEEGKRRKFTRSHGVELGVDVPPPPPLMILGNHRGTLEYILFVCWET